MKRLIEIQKKLKAPKNQYNSFGKYKYRSCEDILEGVKPLLSELGLALVIHDNVQFVEGRFYVVAYASLYDEEGKFIVSSTAYAREEETKKSMDGSQVTGAASSYARKYALNGLFSIDDTKDSDATNEGSKAPSKGSKKVTEAQIKRLIAIAIKKGYNAEQLSSMVYKKYQKATKDLTKEEYDVIVSGLEKLADK